MLPKSSKGHQNDILKTLSCSPRGGWGVQKHFRKVWRKGGRFYSDIGFIFVFACMIFRRCRATRSCSFDVWISRFPRGIQMLPKSSKGHKNDIENSFVLAPRGLGVLKKHFRRNTRNTFLGSKWKPKGCRLRPNCPSDRMQSGTKIDLGVPWRGFRKPYRQKDGFPGNPWSIFEAPGGFWSPFWCQLGSNWVCKSLQNLTFEHRLAQRPSKYGFWEMLWVKHASLMKNRYELQRFLMAQNHVWRYTLRL